MKAVVAAFNQEKALVGAFSMITNLRMTFFEALYYCQLSQFGLVHHFTKLGSGEYYLEELENEICRKNEWQQAERKDNNRKTSFSLTKTVSHWHSSVEYTLYLQ